MSHLNRLSQDGDRDFKGRFGAQIEADRCRHSGELAGGEPFTRERGEA